MDDDILTIEESWPGTTIKGEPGIVSGILSLSRMTGGELLLNLAVGPAGGRPEESDYVEFVLAGANLEALRNALNNV
ncbi:hypothetical protein AB0I28_39335 [Phytomonospora sp. NPDC050363]|uniref:hypothetical protein n=1 Tax=Phytomonospora sp. NPDC050363 TaxID=3155642 RepID=UPI0033EB5EF1